MPHNRALFGANKISALTPTVRWYGFGRGWDRKLLVDPPAGAMQLLARSPTITNDKVAVQFFKAGVITRPLSSMLFHKSKEQGLFLGFAAWNEKEIDRAACIVGRIVR